VSDFIFPNLLGEAKFKRKEELKVLVEKITYIYALLGGKPRYSVWGKQHLDRQEFIETVTLFEKNNSSRTEIMFYISKASKKIVRVEFYSDVIGNFDDLFVDTEKITIRNRLSDGSCCAYLFERPFNNLLDEDIFDFCKKILLFSR
jgi:hypothetical protein